MNFSHTRYISAEPQFFSQMSSYENLEVFLSHPKSYASESPIASSLVRIQYLTSFSYLY